MSLDIQQQTGQNGSAENIAPPAAFDPAEGNMLPATAARDLSHAVCRLEAELLKCPQVEMPVAHDFCDGLYARTMHIPAGTILTGAIHKRESFFLVRRGDLIVTTPQGPVTLRPGDMSVTGAGTKRAGIALTDVVVTTFHANPTGATDPVEIWELFTIPPSQWLEFREDQS